MPIRLIFKPKVTMLENSEIFDEFTRFVISSPFLMHRGVNTTTAVNPDDRSLQHIEIIFQGISTSDQQSIRLFSTYIISRLNDFRLPFYLSDSSFTSPQPGDVMFLHTRFKPEKSKYSKLLSNIPNLNIPNEYCCPLSGDIIETPVYDIRSPSVRYDETFLQYWLGISHPKLVPHTKVPYNQAFFKIDFELQKKIADFVNQTLEAHANKQLESTLQRFNIPITKEKEVLNKALRRASMCGTHEDIVLLFSFGADVNAQDDNQQKKLTALHWAISEKKYENAATLIYSGALINIRDAHGITALQLIQAVDNAEEKKSLTYMCRSHGLINPAAQNNASLFSQRNDAESSGHQSSNQNVM